MAQPLNAGMPDAQHLQAGYTLRVTTIDPTTGNLVSGAKINTVVIDADILTSSASGPPSDIVYGDWMLVPGPGA